MRSEAVNGFGYKFSFAVAQETRSLLLGILLAIKIYLRPSNLKAHEAVHVLS
jgi:hypothetical protein